MAIYSLWYVQIDPTQNIDQSTSLERTYKELLNALISFEIRRSSLTQIMVSQLRVLKRPNLLKFASMYVCGKSV